MNVESAEPWVSDGVKLFLMWLRLMKSVFDVMEERLKKRLIRSLMVCWKTPH